jgi:ribose/xylose/arabinose/galactoside ABC-type transport system permease subunit
VIGVAVCVGVGLVFGALNAFCVLLLGLPSFIATIGTGLIAVGLAVFVTKGDPVYPLPTELTDIGFASPLGLSWGLFVFLALGLLLNYLSRNTRLGRESIAVGGDAHTALIAGIRVTHRKAIAFLMCSGLASIAGLMQIASQGTAVPTLGTGVELASVAAAVVGGVSVFGGSGTITGAMLGVVFLNVLTSGLAASGVSPNWQTFAIGFILILAIALDVARRRRKGLT